MRIGGRGRCRGEGGLAALWFLGLMVGFLAFAGVALDLWRVFSERAGVAAAVDAAAHAGAAEIDEASFREGRVALDPARAEDAAWANLSAQSDAIRFSASEVIATPEHVTVRAEEQVQLTLLRLVTSQPIRVEVTAVAEPRYSG